MRDMKNGEVLLKASLVAHRVKQEELAHALGDTPTAATTAAVGLFFGPTVAGYRQFVDAVALDLNRALLGGHETAWSRPFHPDEAVIAEMTLAERTQKNGMDIGVCETRCCTPQGELIQTQRTTFIERAIAT
jgi:acyl dehydratase